MTAPRESHPPRSRVVAVPFGPITADLVVIGPPGVLAGWALVETTGVSSAQVNIVNGRNAGGTVVAPVALSPGQSTRDTTGLHGVECDLGLTIDVVSGSVSGALWVMLP